MGSPQQPGRAVRPLAQRAVFIGGSLSTDGSPAAIAQYVRPPSLVSTCSADAACLPAAVLEAGGRQRRSQRNNAGGVAGRRGGDGTCVPDGVGVGMVAKRGRERDGGGTGTTPPQHVLASGGQWRRRAWPWPARPVGIRI
jgi:hypothetical protein